jgi:hypothetical protein
MTVHLTPDQRLSRTTINADEDRPHPQAARIAVTVTKSVFYSDGAAHYTNPDFLETEGIPHHGAT